MKKLSEKIIFALENANDPNLGNVFVTANQISSLGPYKVYSALITQASTSAPTANILVNTLGAIPMWARASDGNYTLTLTGAFPSQTKTAILLGPNATVGTATTGAWTNANTITFNGGDLTDDNLLFTFVEIRVYS